MLRRKQVSLVLVLMFIDSRLQAMVTFLLDRNTWNTFPRSELGCFRNSASTEFRMFFLIPYIPYSIWNFPKFRGIMQNSVLRNSKNSAQFRDFSVSRNSALLNSYIFFHCKNCFMTFFSSSFDFIS